MWQLAVDWIEEGAPDFPNWEGAGLDTLSPTNFGAAALMAPGCEAPGAAAFPFEVSFSSPVDLS